MYYVSVLHAALAFDMSVTWAIYGQNKNVVVLLRVSDFTDAMTTETKLFTVPFALYGDTGYSTLRGLKSYC